MKPLLDTLHRYRVYLVVAAAFAFVAWIVIGAFGPALGVDGEFREDFLSGAQSAWQALVTLVMGALAREVTKDEDGDGTPDLLQSSASKVSDR
ncbi:MAG: hypothetical protein AAF411_29625 [Myxococcota bacterium]